VTSRVTASPIDPLPASHPPFIGDRSVTFNFVLQAEEMIHDIRRVFLANLEKVEWMDEKTKQRAKDKVFRSSTF